MSDIKAFLFEPVRKPSYHPSAHSGRKTSHSPEQKAHLIPVGHQASKSLKRNQKQTMVLGVGAVEVINL